MMGVLGKEQVLSSWTGLKRIEEGASIWGPLSSPRAPLNDLQTSHDTPGGILFCFVFIFAVICLFCVLRQDSST